MSLIIFSNAQKDSFVKLKFNWEKSERLVEYQNSYCSL